MKILVNNQSLSPTWRESQQKIQEASKQLATEFMKMLVREMVDNMDLPGSGAERDFIKDTLVQIFADGVAEVNPKFLKKIQNELTKKEGIGTGLTIEASKQYDNETEGDKKNEPV